MPAVMDEKINSAVVFGLLILIGIYLLLELKDYYAKPISGGEDISGGLKNVVKRDKTDIESQIGEDKLELKVLHPVTIKQFEIMATTQISKDTKLFRFKIPNDSNNQPRSIGLAIGKHITVVTKIDGTTVMRPYTPCSSPSQKGYFELLIKSYEFGKMSSHMHSLIEGSSVGIRGPIGRFRYSPNKYQAVALIAGGTGITPCLQVLRHVLENDPLDTTNFILFYQNRTFEDILLRHILDGLLIAFPKRLKVRYFLSNQSSKVPRTAQNVIKGYITPEIIPELVSACQLTCLCGPSGFNSMIRSILSDLGKVENEDVYVW